MSETEPLETKVAILRHRLDQHDHLLERVERTLEGVSSNLQQLVKLQTDRDHDSTAIERAFSEIGEIKTDVQQIKNEMPTLKLSRKAIFWLFGAGGIALLSLVVAVIQLVT